MTSHTLQSLPNTLQSLKNGFWAIYNALCEKGFKKLIKDAWRAVRNGFFNYFEDAVQKSPFDQGKMTGIIVANVVSNILLIISAIGDIAVVVRYFKAGGSIAELFGAYRAGGIARATSTLLKRDPNISFHKGGTEIITPSKAPASGQAGKPQGIIIHEPSEGGSLVPKNSDHPVAAGNDPVAKANQHIDAETRRQLADPRTSTESSRRVSGMSEGELYLKRAKEPTQLAKKLADRLNPSALPGRGFQSHCVPLAIEGYLFMEGLSEGVVVTDLEEGMLDSEIIRMMPKPFEFGINPHLPEIKAKMLARAAEGKGTHAIFTFETQLTSNGFTIDRGHAINVVVRNHEVWFLDLQERLGSTTLDESLFTHKYIRQIYYLPAKPTFIPKLE